jgi:hypothetical protein
MKAATLDKRSWYLATTATQRFWPGRLQKIGDSGPGCALVAQCDERDFQTLAAEASTTHEFPGARRIAFTSFAMMTTENAWIDTEVKLNA